MSDQTVPSSESPSLVEAAVAKPKDFIQAILKPLNKFCLYLGKKNYAYFRTQKVTLRLNPDDYVNARADDREHFIPVRIPVIVDRLLRPFAESKDQTTSGNQSEWDKRADFAKIGAARFHYDSLERLAALEEAFAPFNPDADEKYELAYSFQEKQKKLEQFSSELKETLAACNYNEVSQKALARLLETSLPGRLPVKADYSSCVEFHIYTRGVTPNETEVRLPSQCFGQSYEISTETISRLCVFVRMKNEEPELDKFLTKVKRFFGIKPRKIESEENENRDVGETVLVKTFKNVSLEDLKMIAPKIKLEFPIFDIFKIVGTFTAGTGSAIAKIILAATVSLWAALGLVATFFLAMFKSFMGFIHRRTHYMQRYARQLYFQTLASNSAAVNMLVAGGEAQEIKEFILGYFTALERQGRGIEWSTEEEIDRDAEAWLKESFGLDVDFESNDALRKLREKKLLEIRETQVSENGTLVKQYRVKPLDDALKTLDEDWDNFFEYNV